MWCSPASAYNRACFAYGFHTLLQICMLIHSPAEAKIHAWCFSVCNKNTHTQTAFVRSILNRILEMLHFFRKNCSINHRQNLSNSNRIIFGYSKVTQAKTTNTLNIQATKPNKPSIRNFTQLLYNRSIFMIHICIDCRISWFVWDSRVSSGSLKYNFS